MSSGRSPNPNPNPQQVFGLFSKSIGHNITNSFNMTPKKKKKKKKKKKWKSAARKRISSMIFP